MLVRAADRNRRPALRRRPPLPACAWRKRNCRSRTATRRHRDRTRRRPAKRIEAGARQALEQNAPVLLVSLPHFFQLRAGVESRFSGDLRERRHRNREILLQPLDRAHQRRRHHHPADPPPGHAEIFGERIDDDGVGGHPRGALRREGVVETVVNLVRDDGDAGIFGAAGSGRRAPMPASSCRSDWPARPTITPLSGRARCCAMSASPVIDHRVCAVVSMPHRLAAQRGEDVPIRRIARQRHRHAIARFESGKKRENESSRRAGGDDDAFRIDVETVPFAHRRARCAGAATRYPAFRYSRADRPRAPRAPHRSPSPALPPRAGRLPYGRCGGPALRGGLRQRRRPSP